MQFVWSDCKYIEVDSGHLWLLHSALMSSSSYWTWQTTITKMIVALTVRGSLVEIGFLSFHSVTRNEYIGTDQECYEIT